MCMLYICVYIKIMPKLLQLFLHPFIMGCNGGCLDALNLAQKGVEKPPLSRCLYRGR